MEALLIALPILTAIIGYFLPQEERLDTLEKQFGVLIAISGVFGFVNFVFGILPSTLPTDTGTLTNYLQNIFGAAIGYFIESAVIGLLSVVIGSIGLAIGRNYG